MILAAVDTRARITTRVGEMVTDSDVRLSAFEIASLSARLADMANETGDLRCPLAEIARMAAMAPETRIRHMS